MNNSSLEFTLRWVRTVLPAKLQHSLVARGVAQIPGALDSLTLYEVALRFSPQTFSLLFEPLILGELYLAELLTQERGEDIMYTQSLLGEMRHGESSEQGDSDELA